MKEIRNITQQPAVAAPAEGRKVIEGYALVFETPSTGLGFREIIHRSALNGVLERSDVFALLDHNASRGVLARANKGTGSLALTVDERGLKYSFEVPDTELGRETYEGVQRGDIAGSSFTFTVEKDRWERSADGVAVRHIDEINMLYDVSPVYCPAYDATTVVADRRGLDALEQREAEAEEEKEQEPDKETDDADDADESTDDTEADKDAANDGDSDGDTSDDTHTENRSADNPESNNSNPDIMPKKEKRFSLIRAIADVAEGRALDESAASVVAEGRAAFRAINQTANGQIVLPVAESRAEDGGGDAAAASSDPIVVGTATKGKEAVATDKFNFLGPLRSAMVLARAGANFMTGLVGDIAMPFYSGSNVGWKGEVVAADDGKGAFSEVTMKPKRLTAFIDVSKQFLIQDSVGAEDLLRRDIVDALAEKLEKTILGSEAGTNERPAGVFNGVAADTAALKYADIVALEAAIEEANVTGELKYIVSPAAKAVLRTTTKDTGSGRFIMEGGEVEGIPVLSTSAVVSKGVLLGDFRELVIGQWGGIDLTIDPVTKATEGMVRIVINAYFDAVVRRPAAFQKKILK